MPHYRDAKAGEFLIAPEAETSSGPEGVPPFLRFCGRRGAVGDLLSRSRPDPRSLLGAAEL
ncbi:MAG: hypothetical protein L0H64_09450, partial [Pseudonocardia sp.]|nr:hypothetical protein [Pseudonocardia sp.]